MPSEISPSLSSIPKINFGKISRRPHPRDAPSCLPPGMKPYPTSLNSPILAGNAEAHVYQNWRLMAAASMSSAPFPIGSTTSLRTYENPSLELDPSNFYSGTQNVTPGPGSYDVLSSFGGIGAGLSRRAGSGPSFAGTQGSAPRDCLLPQASHCLPWRRTISPRPGPGAYQRGDEAIFGRISGTFDTRDREVQELEDKVTAMAVVESDIRRLKEKSKGIDKLSPDEARLFKLDMARSSKNLKAKLAIVSEEVRLQKDKMSSIANHPGCNGKAKSILYSNVVPKCVPLCNTADRFFDPILSKASFLSAPGPGTHDVSHFGSSFGNATIGVGDRGLGKPSAWGKGIRPMDVRAPDAKGVATLRLNNHGYSYFCDLNEQSGVSYQPNAVPRGKAAMEGPAREQMRETQSAQSVKSVSVKSGGGGKRKGKKVGVVVITKLE